MSASGIQLKYELYEYSILRYSSLIFQLFRNRTFSWIFYGQLISRLFYMWWLIAPNTIKSRYIIKTANRDLNYIIHTKHFAHTPNKANFLKSHLLKKWKDNAWNRLFLVNTFYSKSQYVRLQLIGTLHRHYVLCRSTATS